MRWRPWPAAPSADGSLESAMRAGYKLGTFMARRVRTAMLLALTALTALHAPTADAQPKKKKAAATAPAVAQPSAASTAPGADTLGPAREHLRAGRYKEAERAAAEIAKSDPGQKSAAAVVRARA